MVQLLRDEGITPAMIQKNRGLLVNAVKATLKDEIFFLGRIGTTVIRDRAGIQCRQQHHVERHSIEKRILPGPPFSLISPKSLLGSAPPRSASFTDAFLQRQNGAASSLDQKQNVENGITVPTARHE
ncbi:MAG: hypothetical protein ALECFALPRED_009505 [Alectoria fallacina]|uniref:Uncharacterized protein n=1 Tax=Alectoria fallacina TaxID=1903189 RepID=A0A8H3I427_9LECA|nr:MAG: hypothetical protein ALECFALPRED_009505 [Alectoria fallacina]